MMINNMIINRCFLMLTLLQCPHNTSSNKAAENYSVRPTNRHRNTTAIPLKQWSIKWRTQRGKVGGSSAARVHFIFEVKYTREQSRQIIHMISWEKGSCIPSFTCFKKNNPKHGEHMSLLAACFDAATWLYMSVHMWVATMHQFN